MRSRIFVGGKSTLEMNISKSGQRFPINPTKLEFPTNPTNPRPTNPTKYSRFQTHKAFASVTPQQCKLDILFNGILT